MGLKKVGIIGSGNIAYHLSVALADHGCSVEWIFSRNKDTGRALAQKLRSVFNDSIMSCSTVDLILICVKDDAIQEIVAQLPSNANIAYTSGTYNLADITSDHQNLGVFYPLQTFSKDREVNIFEVPFLIEAKNDIFKQQLFDLAWKLSRNVQFVTSQMRMHLHLSAVFVNNFGNHLSTLAKEHLERNNLNWEILIPLIKETAAKVVLGHPELNQTGPAMRGDYGTINKHLENLKGDEKEIYKTLTNSILSHNGYEKL